MKRIKQFGVYQTAKVFAFIYFLMAAIIMIPMGLISMMVGNNMFPGLPFGGGMFFILLPFLYGFIGFIGVAIACAVYNLISRWTGGIELEIETVDEAAGHEAIDNI